MAASKWLLFKWLLLVDGYFANFEQVKFDGLQSSCLKMIMIIDCNNSSNNNNSNSDSNSNNHSSSNSKSKVIIIIIIIIIITCSWECGSAQNSIWNGLLNT